MRKLRIFETSSDGTIEWSSSEVAEVPWCAEHDRQWLHDIYSSEPGFTPCRLEDPPRHFKIGEAE